MREVSFAEVGEQGVDVIDDQVGPPWIKNEYRINKNEDEM